METENWLMRKEGKMTNPLFTKKHYKAIAKVLKKAKCKIQDRGDYESKIWNNALVSFMNAFEEDNPKFDETKFEKEINKS